MTRHGGNLRELARQANRSPEAMLDFSANLNPLGPPDWLRSLVNARLDQVAHYPDPDSTELIHALAKRLHADPAEVVVGNGSAELLTFIPLILQAHRALIPVPAYGDYRVAAEAAGLEVNTLLLCAEDDFQLDFDLLETRLQPNDLVLLGRPNNPAGCVCDGQRLRALAKRWPAVTFVIDEAFADFAEPFDSLSEQRPANVVVLRSLTKFYAIPGLRLGCALADSELACRLRKRLPPWSVNVLAQAVGVAALDDSSDYAHRTRQLVTEERNWLTREIAGLGKFTVFKSEANFLLLRLEQQDFDGAELARRTLRQGIAIRVCSDFDGLDGRYIRVAVRNREENTALCGALADALGVTGHASARPRKVPALMFQGTCSGAGKSLLATAFCRILLEDGYRVAPFKSQNMSLNSFVTRDGGEMGRAQVVQAQAARMEPDVRMNPILIKPSSDTGAQVVVCGHPVGNMSVEEYIQYKPVAFERALEAYASLSAQNDVMVLEGAGSPAEVNLKEHDIANMQMARRAGARVVVVGDIDRGGVFAAFAGTLDALSEWERRLVFGFIVNKFRGRAELLADALTWTLRTTGRPVLGVVPLLRDLGIPEEDSLGLSRGERTDGGADDAVHVVVVELPHLSNFTDFDALRLEPDVRLRFLRSPENVGVPDVLVLPGSKNVFSDLAFLRDNGWNTLIKRLAADGKTKLFGICGGLQLLGQKIFDPNGLESAGDAVSGLGFLRIETTLEREKTLARARATHVRSGLPVYGYEIHHGRSRLNGACAALVREDGEVIGVETGDHSVWGTYLHGIFDSDPFRRFFIDELRRRRGLRPLVELQAHYDVEPGIQRLADTVRACVDIQAVYREIGLL